jgi:hypothetical protein
MTMGIFATILGNMAAGAARSVNDKYATETAMANAKAKAKGGGGAADCSPCKARAMQHEVQQSLGLKKGWYKA